MSELIADTVAKANAIVAAAREKELVESGPGRFGKKREEAMTAMALVDGDGEAVVVDQKKLVTWDDLLTSKAILPSGEEDENVARGRKIFVP